MKQVIRLGLKRWGGCWAGWEYGQQGHREHWQNIWSLHQCQSVLTDWVDGKTRIWRNAHLIERNATYLTDKTNCAGGTKCQFYRSPVLLTCRLLVVGVSRCRRSSRDLCDKEEEMHILYFILQWKHNITDCMWRLHLWGGGRSSVSSTPDHMRNT